MKPTLYNYQLHTEHGDPAKPFVQRHYFQTLPEAVYTLLRLGTQTADHQQLAQATGIQTIATISVADHYEPLLTASAHPLLPGKQPPRAGLKLTYHAGTITDLQQTLKVPLNDFASFQERRNYLWLADYRRQATSTVDFDPAIHPLQDSLAGQARQLGAYQFIIEQDLSDGYKAPIHRGAHIYHFESGLWALWALTRHPYLDEANWAPFTAAINPAQMIIRGPHAEVMAKSGLVAHNDPLRHLYPQAGLYLTFQTGLESYLQTHAPDVAITTNLYPAINAIVLADISADNERLIPTPAYHELQYQLSRELGNHLAPAYGGYYIEFGYLPTRIPLEQLPTYTPAIKREFPNTFVGGIETLQAHATVIGDRTGAVKSMADQYLAQAIMYDSGKEVARLFKKTVVDQDLPPGLYLQITRENLTPNALAKLGLFLSKGKQAPSLNFLFTSTGDQPPPDRKHGSSPRTMIGDGGSHRTL